MALEVRVGCINKTDRFNPHERIKAIGGVNADGSRWRLTEDEAIQGILQGKWEFYVERPPGHRVGVFVARTAAGHQFLKTIADGEQPDNLLSLPECPQQ